ncbi:MAG: CopD family protein [Chromatiales bacterium]|nr:CopD family protein [Chromatiales bacterium]
MNLSTAASVAGLLGLALLIGVAAAWLGLQPPGIGSNQRGTHWQANRLSRWFWCGIALSLLSGAADLLLRASALTELPLTAAWPELPQVLSGTRFGTWWLTRMAAVLLLALAWLWQRASTPVALATGALAVLLALVVSATGHAGDNGFDALAVSNTLHISAGCLWGGTVLVYAFAVAPGMRRGQAAPAHSAESAQRLSLLAALALFTVLATGIYNAWHLLGNLPALWTSTYGQILLLKLCFVAGMMMIGLNNRTRAVPRVRAWARPPQLSPMADAPLAHFQRVLRIDAALFLFVLACAAVLSGTNPPTH